MEKIGEEKVRTRVIIEEPKIRIEEIYTETYVCPSCRQDGEDVGFSINGASLKPLKIQVVECHKKNNLNSRMRRNEKWQNIMTENLKNR
ncbi:IS66 family transposase zinc-finger binding domain-containing protein, partial [Dubosiella newyorkensis]